MSPCCILNANATAVLLFDPGDVSVQVLMLLLSSCLLFYETKDKFPHCGQ